jgi:hypothetical protein
MRSPIYALAFNGSREATATWLTLTITADGPTPPTRGHAP